MYDVAVVRRFENATMDVITVRGARTHNLKSVNVELPRNRLVVITGPSGSGKSSLAFNTLYAEGRRRYVESLSVYARQLLGALGRPDVEQIDGLSPAIAIEQRALGRNPRSTVGTITEIDDYLRLLLARIGDAYCPRCNRAVHAHTVTEIVNQVLAFGDGARVSIMAAPPKLTRQKAEQLLAAWRREGFVRVRVGGTVHDLAELLELGDQASSLELVIDRVVIKDGVRARVLDAVEMALKHGDGLVRAVAQDGRELLLSERFACSDCGVTLPEIEPQLFSFNSPKGACAKCNGLGVRAVADVERLVPDPSRSLREGAITAFKRGLPRELEQWARAVGLNLDAPFAALADRAKEELLHGDGDGFSGVLSLIDANARTRVRVRDGDDEDEETSLDRFRVEAECEACGGTRLRPEALCVKIGAENIHTLSQRPLRLLGDELNSAVARLAPSRRKIVERLLGEICSRLSFLNAVGVPYLTLRRAGSTLSSGEGQRVRLATQIGSALVGVLYVLDEPSVGLHPRDSAKLLETVKTLVQQGNSVIVVEHDLETIAQADYVVDMGPGAGRLGGQVVAAGTPAEIRAVPASVTGPYLSKERFIAVPKHRRRTNAERIVVRGAKLHNLKAITTEFPLGTLIAVTGVSGSGKSSLVLGTLLPAAKAAVNRDDSHVPNADSIEGLHLIDRVVAVDSAPIGRTPRSSPATYTGVFGALRELFAGVPDARARGFKAGRFSFNVKGGRCENCQGEGAIRVEMNFLPDVTIPCESCGGLRYERETLSVKWRGLSIADYLAMTVDEALAHFDAVPKVRDALQALHDVGLGYVALGQPATTLSGGEAQRVKLAKELARKATGKTLYVLDEPTTGLHLADIELLLELLQKLVSQGNTVVLVEHQMDVVKCADWVIDIGPDGGELGGELIIQGPPETVIEHSRSFTAAPLAAAMSLAVRGVKQKSKNAETSRANRGRKTVAARAGVVAKQGRAIR
jgi:excinuclease ABC subunit A